MCIRDSMYDPGAAEDVPLRGYRAPEPVEISGPSSLKIDYGALALPYETHRVSVDGFDPADGVSVWSTYATPHSRRQLSLIHISEPKRLLSISYAVFCLK